MPKTPRKLAGVKYAIILGDKGFFPPQDHQQPSRVMPCTVQVGLDVRGQGVAKDYTETVKWYRKAAEQSHTGAREWLRKLGLR